MLSSVSLARRSTCRLPSLAGSSRSLSSTAPTHERFKDPASTPTAFKEWLKTSPDASRYRNAKRPKNWLGDTPFPQNPSFKPPVPVSNALKNAIFDQFMADPQANSVRALASKYHLSIKRVEAILRLKGLEQHWVKGKALKTGFLYNMEWHLGVKADLREHQNHEEWVQSRLSAVEADKLYDLQGDEMARSRYERMFFEPTLEGQAPILPGALEKENKQKDVRRAKRMEEKYDPSILGQHIDRAARPSVVTTKSGTAPGRPTLKFVDVGARWVDVEDRKKRVQAAERRALLSAQRRLPGEHHREAISNAEKSERVKAAQQFKNSYRSMQARAEARSLRGRPVRYNRFAARRHDAVKRAVAQAKATA
ncbi:unnamed protein product [Peniophora sp. CBMAI 1063]|nr:unnamed protein product [Peniophora sp. CBMAI 1063]